MSPSDVCVTWPTWHEARDTWHHRDPRTVEIIAGNSPSFGDESNQNHKFITHLDRGQHQVWLWHSIRTQLNNFYLRESRLCKMSGSFNNPFMSGCDQSQMPVDVIVYRYRQHPGSDSAVAMVEILNFYTNTFGKPMPMLQLWFRHFKVAL